MQGSNKYTLNHIAVNPILMPSPLPPRWCPEENANWLSRLFFLYVNSLITKGAEKHLLQHDLWDVSHDDEPGRVYRRFEHELQHTKHPDKAPEVCCGGKTACTRVVV